MCVKKKKKKEHLLTRPDSTRGVSKPSTPDPRDGSCMTREKTCFVRPTPVQIVARRARSMSYRTFRAHMMITSHFSSVLRSAISCAAPTGSPGTQWVYSFHALAEAKTIDPRIPAMSGRSTSSFHRPGKKDIARTKAVRCSVCRMMHPTKRETFQVIDMAKLPPSELYTW